MMMATHYNGSFKKLGAGPGEMAQVVRALAILEEDQGFGSL